MPSAMIHLLTAYKYKSDALGEFFVGNVLPDAIRERSLKDTLHFRDREDRLEALEEFARTLDMKRDINHGILLHLFLDYNWDICAIKNYIDNYKGEGDWFPSYREETALATSYLFHNKEWANEVWEKMMDVPMSAYENINGIPKENILECLNRNIKWHSENNIGPSNFYPSEYIEEFTSRTSEEFRIWISKIDI